MEPKVEIAAEAVALRAGVSIATVYRAASAVKDYEDQIAKAAAQRTRSNARIDLALAKLRDEQA